MIKVLDNFFPNDVYDKMLEDSKNNWQNKEYFIYKDLTEELYTIDVINYMSSKLDKNITLYRAYSHGHPSDYPHNIHQDKNSTHTAILFLNKDYYKDWQGGTIIYTNCTNYIDFVPNRLIIFEANLDHVGTPFTNTNNFRLQNVWKININ